MNILKIQTITEHSFSLSIMLMANYGFCTIFAASSGNRGRKIHMKWLCSVGIAVSLALQPALADDLFGNHPLTPKRGMRSSTNCLRK
ncbi:hypothetical protein ACNKHR_23250 [Shigella flexneri]